MQEKQRIYEKELEKIRDNMTEKINDFIEEQPTRVQLIRTIEENDIKDE
ncbi:MAG: hypothetical protein U9Q66_02755 [Patescibacteria group bacterium]|nr:hypothetical protein [Patescibacteria group bacterium]